MNDLSQAPKQNMMLEALIERLFRIHRDTHLSHDERAALMLATALQTSSLVKNAQLRTITRTLEWVERNGVKVEEWIPCTLEELDEQLLMELQDGRDYAFSLGTPPDLMR